MPQEISWEVIVILFMLLVGLIGIIYRLLRSDIDENKKGISAIKEEYVKEDVFAQYRKDLKEDLHEFKVHVTAVVNKVESDLGSDISEVKKIIDKIYDLLINKGSL